MSNKLTAAALAGLLSASIMTAGVAYANDHEKTSCKGKDKMAAEKQCCKTADGKAKDPSECKDGKASCKGKDKAKEDEAK